MTYSILIPLGLHNTNHPRRLLEWWADDNLTRVRDQLREIVAIAAEGGCREIVLALPFGTPLTGRQESDQILRVSEFKRTHVLGDFTFVAFTRNIRPVLYTGIGWPNRPWSPFGWRLGVPSLGADGRTYDWRLPTMRSAFDRRAVIADLQAAKDIGFDGVWIDQLAQVDAERPGEGGLWARYIEAQTKPSKDRPGLKVAGEAHWGLDMMTDMVSLGRDIDARETESRVRHLESIGYTKANVVSGIPRDIAWINGHTTIDGTPEGEPVRTPADQVAAGRRYEAMGFEVCYEVDSAETMRGIVEARAGKGGT